MDNKLNNISGFRLLNLIMRYGSLSLAAREMNISLSSASHILANMKQLLNDDLFFRTKNGLEPTQKMREIWPDISSAVNSIDRVFEPENTSLETVRRQFRLVVTDTGYVSFISPVTGLICRQAPGIEIEICQPGSDSEIVDGLRHGSFDFAINPNPPKAFDLIYHKLRELKYVLLVRAGHPLTKQNIGENFDIKKLLDFVQIIYGS